LKAVFGVVSPFATKIMARHKAREMAVVRLERSPIHLLHRAGQCASDVFQGEMAEGDLTPRQYAVLVAVSQNEGLSQTNLVEKTGVDRSTLADIVRRMLKKGLLQRRRTKDDARAYAVKLTDEGWRILKAADPLAKRVDEKILAALPGQQRDRFLQDLSLIVEALSKLQADGGKA
jgi:DNA-binding MarR family transcriptional regulator